MRHHKTMIVSAYALLACCAAVIAFLFLSRAGRNMAISDRAEVQAQASTASTRDRTTRAMGPRSDEGPEVKKLNAIASRYLGLISQGYRSIAAETDTWESEMSALTGEYSIMTQDGTYMPRSEFNSLLADAIISGEVEGRLDITLEDAYESDNGMTAIGILSGKLYGDFKPTISMLGIPDWDGESPIRISISFITDPADTERTLLITCHKA